MQVTDFKSLIDDLHAQTGFFKLYAHELDFKNNCISVRTGKYLNKKDMQWRASGKVDRNLVRYQTVPSLISFARKRRFASRIRSR